jgi:death-on-curing protein
LTKTVRAIQEIQLARHGGESGVQDESRLQAVLQAPQDLFEQTPETSFHVLAAVYAAGLATSKPFADGNKRTALVVGATFLYDNGWLLKAAPADAVIATTRLASGEWSQEQFCSWLQNNSVPL